MARMIRRSGLSLTTLGILALGCSADERLVRQAETASERQADQNRQIARQNQELAKATQELLAHDAQSRQEAMSLQHDLQAEQRTVGHERDQLERERRQWAIKRDRDQLIATVIADAALLVACLLPLILCWYLLFSIRREPMDRELGELLATELVTGEPMLLPIYESRPSEPGLLPGQTRFANDDRRLSGNNRHTPL